METRHIPPCFLSESEPESQGVSSPDIGSYSSTFPVSGWTRLREEFFRLDVGGIEPPAEGLLTAIAGTIPHAPKPKRPAFTDLGARWPFVLNNMRKVCNITFCVSRALCNIAFLEG
jgi:hypothetical protein